MTDFSLLWHALLLDFALKAFFVVFGTPAVVSFLVGILLGCTAIGWALHSGLNVIERLIKNHTSFLLKTKMEKMESKPSYVIVFTTNSSQPIVCVVSCKGFGQGSKNSRTRQLHCFSLDNSD